MCVYTHIHTDHMALTADFNSTEKRVHIRPVVLAVCFITMSPGFQSHGPRVKHVAL